MTHDRLAAALALTLIPAGLAGCATNCVRGAHGTTCTAKSLKRFDGTPPVPQAVDRAPGAPVTIHIEYGSVLVSRSNSDKVEVEFRPFCYAGYDDQAGAFQQLAQNLQTTVQASGAVTVVVARNGGTSGLGANVNVRLPDGFDGPLNIVNFGNGPLNEFDVRIDFVGQATAVDLKNQSLLGGCYVAGRPTVRNTSVVCGGPVSVFDVSDRIDIVRTDDRHPGGVPAITLRMGPVSPGSPGGRVLSASGAVAATFPSAGGYALDARSPVKGSVQVNGVPAVCQIQEETPGAKKVTCGAGPTYQITAGDRPTPTRKPESNDVVLNFQ